MKKNKKQNPETNEKDDLKACLRRLARAEPDFFDELLDARFLRNPFPPSRAGARLIVDPAAQISPCAHIELCEEDSRVFVGPHSCIDAFAWLRAWGEGIRIGSRCTLHQYSMLQGGVLMGDDVRIGAHTVFVASEHSFSRRDIPIHRQGVVKKGIKLGSDIYVGSNVVVLDGVNIGDGAVVAAGAVVTADVQPYTVVAGVPARVLRERQGGGGE